MDGEEIPQYSKEVAKGSFWNFLGNVAFKIISFIYVIIVARAAAQEDVGLFYLSLSILNIFSVISDFGISGALVRYIPYFEGKGESGKVKDLLRLSHLVLTVFGILLMSLLWWQASLIGSIYQNDKLPDAIRMFSAFILLNNLFRLYTQYIQGEADMKSLQFIQNVQNALKLILTIIFFYFFGVSVLAIIGAFLISYLLATIIAGVKVYQLDASISKPAISLSRKEFLNELVPLGITLAVIQSFSVIISSSDRLILGYLSDPSRSIETIAVYSIATTLASVLMIFPGTIGSVFLPLVSRLVGKNDLVQVRSIMETAQRWSLFITIPVGIIMIIFSSDMLTLFYGASYAAGGMAMSVFTLGLLFSSISYMAYLVLAAMRLIRIELGISIVGAIINLVLNIILIPILGMEGAALASAISFIITMLLLQYYAERLFGFGFPSSIYKLFAAGIVTFLVLLLLKPSISQFLPLAVKMESGDMQIYLSKFISLAYLGLLVGLSAIFFMFFGLLLKCLKKEDATLLKKALQRIGAPQSIYVTAEKLASYGVADQK